MLTIAADLSESINLEHGSIWGHYDPETNPLGTRIKAAIQEAGNASTAIGLVSQSASLDPDEVRRRVGDQRHVRRVHAADVHAGAGLESAESGQQVPDGRAAHPRRALRPRDGGRRPHAFRHLRAAGVEAVPARPGDSPELLGLQRRGAGLLRGGRDRRARSEGRHHHARSRQAGLPRRQSRDVRGHRSAGGGERLLRHSRLRAGPADGTATSSRRDRVPRSIS